MWYMRYGIQFSVINSQIVWDIVFYSQLLSITSLETFEQ